jgi:hypothetical protein
MQPWLVTCLLQLAAQQQRQQAVTRNWCCRFGWQGLLLQQVMTQETQEVTAQHQWKVTSYQLLQLATRPQLATQQVVLQQLRLVTTQQLQQVVMQQLQRVVTQHQMVQLTARLQLQGATLRSRSLCSTCPQ